MSYDVSLFPVPAGMTAQEVAETDVDPAARRPAFDIAALTRRAKLVTAIATAFPELVPQETESATAVTELWADEIGATVTVEPDAVYLTFAYWDHLWPDRVATLTVGICALVTEETGWRSWDPQQCAEVSAAHRDAIEASFTRMVGTVRRMHAPPQVAPPPTGVRRFLRWLRGG